MPSEKKYMAASVPRYMRTARLGHLPLKTIIGCWYVQKEGDVNFIFDVIMLPADQFMRAKSYLGLPEMGTPALAPGKFAPPYIPKDTKEVTVPEGELDPEAYAKAHFLKAFNLAGKE